MQSKLNKFFLSIFLFASAFSCRGVQTNFSTPEHEINSAGLVYFNNKVDILFVIDSSASMSQYRQRFANHINSFIVQLNSRQLDYRVALANMDMDDSNQLCSAMPRQLVGLPSYLTADNIHLLKTRFFENSVSCQTTMGLDSMAHVISQDYLTQIDSDFIRDDAFLNVIFISDENDSSNEYGQSESEDFINILNSRKSKVPGYSRGWSAHFIGYLNEFSTCDVLGSLLKVGSSYLRLVKASDGLSHPICNSNLYDVLNGLSKKIIQVSRTIKFAREPRETTIRVYVDDILIPRSAENGYLIVAEHFYRTEGLILTSDEFHAGKNNDTLTSAAQKQYLVIERHDPSGVNRKLCC